jgi:hypothetical protein
MKWKYCHLIDISLRCGDSKKDRHEFETSSLHSNGLRKSLFTIHTNQFL